MLLWLRFIWRSISQLESYFIRFLLFVLFIIKAVYASSKTIVNFVMLKEILTAFNELFRFEFCRVSTLVLNKYSVDSILWRATTFLPSSCWILSIFLQSLLSSQKSTCYICISIFDYLSAWLIHWICIQWDMWIRFWMIWTREVPSCSRFKRRCLVVFNANNLCIF